MDSHYCVIIYLQWNSGSTQTWWGSHAPLNTGSGFPSPQSVWLVLHVLTSSRHGVHLFLHCSSQYSVTVFAATTTKQADTPRKYNTFILPWNTKAKKGYSKNVKNPITYLLFSKNNVTYLPRTLLASEPDLRRLNDGSFILIFILYRLLRNFDYLSRRLTQFTSITIWSDVWRTLSIFQSNNNIIWYICWNVFEYVSLLLRIIFDTKCRGEESNCTLLLIWQH